MNRFQRQDRPRAPVQPSRRHESLSEQRYADMLKSASALFASADVDTDSVRRAAIDEINELMTQYGLTVDDLK
jgi:hypothetical protein